MNIRQKLASLISGEHYLNVREIKAQFEAYRLARKDRPRESHQPMGYTGRSAGLNSHDLMNRRSRDLVRNTPGGKRIKSMLTNLIVGSGMHAYAWPFLPSETLELLQEIKGIQLDGKVGDRLRYALESDDLFEEYSSDKKQFDIENRLTYHEMLRMGLGESITVGTGLMVRTFREDYDPEKHLAPVAWQMFEREQLDESRDRERTKGQNKIVNGIEYNRLNQPVKYYLQLDHPHDYFNIGAVSTFGPTSTTGGNVIAVEADRVIDFSFYDRPSSSIGHSAFDASGQPIWDYDNYCGSEIQSAAVDAEFAFVAKLNHGEKYAESDWGFGSSDDTVDDHGNRHFQLGRSPVAAVIGKDEELEFKRPARPNRDAPVFLQQLDHDAARSVDLAYHSYSGNYNQASFTSVRSAKMDEDLAIGPLQLIFGNRVVLPIRKSFNSFAAATGRLSSVTPSEFKKNSRRYQRFDVIGQARDLTDPFKEGEARTGRLRTKISTFKEECARKNKHWIRQLIQISLEQKVFEFLGVKPDFTKSGSGQNGSGQQVTADQIAESIQLFGE